MISQGSPPGGLADRLNSGWVKRIDLLFGIWIPFTNLTTNMDCKFVYRYLLETEIKLIKLNSFQMSNGFDERNRRK
jgi:hypothetical protein